MTKNNQRRSGTKLIEQLIDVLSDTYVLAVKTHGYHWNVTGPLFPQLHELFGKHYEALFEAADEIAERIRALEEWAPSSMKAFLDNTKIKESSGEKLSAALMIKELVRSHEIVRDRLIDAAEAAANVDDKATEDLMIQRIQEHDKTLWILRSQLD